MPPELVDALGGDLMMSPTSSRSSCSTSAKKKRITLGDVENHGPSRQTTLTLRMTDAISAKDRTKALLVLDALLSTGEGEEASIGHIYMLAKTFRQMLVILERNVRDQRMLWAALWQGFRVPPFAAEDIIKQARRYKSKRELTRAIRLTAKAIWLCGPIREPSHGDGKACSGFVAAPQPEIGWQQDELLV